MRAMHLNMGEIEKQTRKNNSQQNYCLVWTRDKETNELVLEELGLPVMRKLWVAKLPS